MNELEIDFAFDKAHIWHPYTSMNSPLPTYGVIAASGCQLTLNDGRKLIDGTSSWWACVHGYSHPHILAAMSAQMQQVSHVMFGGITHQPAIELSKRLVAMTCDSLTKVFLADSGSIAVEVALKMALQYWQGRNKPEKQRILTVKHGYHGDTFAAMSVCDPLDGMHKMFDQSVIPQLFADAPKSPFSAPLKPDDLDSMTRILTSQHQNIAAIIIEPIMQGAGGMRFYSADYLVKLKTLCLEYNVLLILDEIATGFGRTGKLFAYEHANIEPDILCVGKALTGGHISLAATLCSDAIAQGISDSPARVFMHGPTFMANPLACSAACASLDLINQGHWQQQVRSIEQHLSATLFSAQNFAAVKDVRVLGAVGVIEMKQNVNVAALQEQFVDLGVWIRPFGSLIYIMPPFIISPEELTQLTDAMLSVASRIKFESQEASQVKLDSSNSYA